MCRIPPSIRTAQPLAPDRGRGRLPCGLRRQRQRRRRTRTRPRTRGPSTSVTSSSSRAARRSSRSFPAGFSLPGLRSPAAGLGRHHQAAVPGRLDRPPGPDALSDRSQRLSGAGGAGSGQSAKRPGQRRSRAHPRQPLQAAGPDAGDLEAGLYQRRRPGAAGRCRGRAELAAVRSAQINLRFTRVPAPITRTHRRVERHRRRARHGQPDGCADHHHSPRPGVRRHPGIGRRPARAAPGA